MWKKRCKKVDGVRNAEVSLDKAEATIEMDEHVPLEKLQAALAGSQYDIHLPDTIPQHKIEKKKATPTQGSGIYYCPMHCEGNKTYDHPGSCPICGMDLVQRPLSAAELTEDSGYKKLLTKFKIALAFTLPIFIIAMTEMMPNNPLV